MYFGGKAFQHRFYDAPKVRQRHHLQGEMVPQYNNQRYRSVSAFDSGHNQQSMKESYLKLINNGVNSRILNKDQLGYEGVKFQKDIIDRYSDNDYRKNSQIMQKYRKQAQQYRRNKRHQHLRKRQNHSHHSQVSKNIQNVKNSNISFLPITNNLEQQTKIVKPKNTSKIQASNFTDKTCDSIQLRNKLSLPALNLRAREQINKDTTRTIQIQEEELHNYNQKDQQNQYNQRYQHQMNQVYDVGINANLTQENQDGYNKSHMKIKRSLKDQQKVRKVQSQRVRFQKQKNKLLKIKYDRLKKRFMEKSLIQSKVTKLYQERLIQQNQQMFDQKIQNLSQVIQNLCVKLKQCDSEMVDQVDQVHGRNKENKLEPNPPKDSRNQTQIKLLKAQELFEELQKKAKIQNKIKSKDLFIVEEKNATKYPKIKPKIVYTFNKEQKNIKNDPLWLLKTRMRQQNFQFDSLRDCSVKDVKRNKTQPS